MGMDGISISNTGAIKEQTSTEYANKTEQLIQSDPANITKHVQNLNTNKKVQEKENSEEGFKKKNSKQKQQDETFQDGLVEDVNELGEEDIYVENLENINKDFYVKLNIKDDIIELYDSSTDRLIETISGNELGELVQKLNMASGIFINKKV